MLKLGAYQDTVPLFRDFAASYPWEFGVGGKATSSRMADAKIKLMKVENVDNFCMNLN